MVCPCYCGWISFPTVSPQNSLATGGDLCGERCQGARKSVFLFPHSKRGTLYTLHCGLPFASPFVTQIFWFQACKFSVFLLPSLSQFREYHCPFPAPQSLGNPGMCSVCRRIKPMFWSGQFAYWFGGRWLQLWQSPWSSRLRLFLRFFVSVPSSGCWVLKLALPGIQIIEGLKNSLLSWFLKNLKFAGISRSKVK